MARIDNTKMINKAVAAKLQVAFRKSKRRIERATGELVMRFLHANDTVKWLYAEPEVMGISNTGVIDKIIQRIGSSVQFDSDIRAVNRGLKGGFQVSMIQRDYSDIMDYGIEYSSTQKKWNWLDFMINHQHAVLQWGMRAANQFETAQGWSRQGGWMFRGGRWQLPEHAKDSHNFIIRTFKNTQFRTSLISTIQENLRD